MRPRDRALLLAGLSLPFAELGHVLAYGLRVPDKGAHGYFPSLLHAAGAVAGGALLGALALLALSRALGGPARRRRPWQLAPLFSGLLALQLAAFLVQEGLEAGSLPDAHTVVLGLLGQQPVALAAALALRWLSARMGPALEALRLPRRPWSRPRPVPPPVTPRGRLRPIAPGATARHEPLGRRAPPLLTP